MRHILLTVIALTGALSLLADTTYTAVLTGIQETPASGSSARGSCTMTYHDVTNSFDISLSFAGIQSQIGAHIHFGIFGTPGVIVFALPNGSPITTTWTTPTPQNVQDFLDGKYYVNVHSAAFPGGEIRGQILPTLNINAGGTQFTDPQGNLWDDTGGFTGTTSRYVVSNPINNTPIPYVFQSERWAAGPLSLTRTLPRGMYNVELGFAEVYFQKPGQRVFDIQVEGQTVKAGYDIVAQAGASSTAVTVAFPVTNTSGTITFSLIRATLGSLGQQQFTAAMVAKSQTDIVWSISPAGKGSIDANGLYTAPASFLPGDTVTITASSQSDPTKSVSGTVVLVNLVSSDLGAPAGGSSIYVAGSYTEHGAGDLFASNDFLHGTCTTGSGDGEIVARVNAPFTGAIHKFGVDMRESPGGSSAAHASSLLFGGIVGLSAARNAAGAGTANSFGPSGIFWFRQIRTGNQFSSFISNDGVRWNPNGSGSVQNINMVNPAMWCLASAGGFGGTPPTAVFDSVRFSKSPVEVSIDQDLVQLGPGQGAQLSATVTGTPNTGVLWSIAPPAWARLLPADFIPPPQASPCRRASPSPQPA